MAGKLKFLNVEHIHVLYVYKISDDLKEKSDNKECRCVQRSVQHPVSCAGHVLVLFSRHVTLNVKVGGVNWHKT